MDSTVVNEEAAQTAAASVGMRIHGVGSADPAQTSAETGGKGEARTGRKKGVVCRIKMLAFCRRGFEGDALLAALAPLRKQVAEALGVAISDESVQWTCHCVETESDSFQGVAVLICDPEKPPSLTPWRQLRTTRRARMKPDFDEKILQLGRDGFSISKIAAEMKCSLNTVLRVRKQAKNQSSIPSNGLTSESTTNG